MRLVALDVGEKRIGVATADTSVRIAVPSDTISVDGNEFEKIAKIMQDEKANHLIVGLPRNSKGEETAQSKYVRDFVSSLQSYFVKNRLEKPLVKFQDESLTSVIAELNLSQNKRKKHQKGDIDREAATLIMQDFLDSFNEKSMEQKKEIPVKEKNAKKKPKAKFRILKILAFIACLAIVVAVGAVTWYADATKARASGHDCDGAKSEICVSTKFEILDGESTNSIATRLEDSGIIKSSLAFKIYLRVAQRKPILRIGAYELSSTMSVAEIVGELEKGSFADTFRVTFLPGGSINDAKNSLLAAGYPSDEIEDAFAANYDHPAMQDKPANGSIEGYIYGETYEFYAGASVRDVLNRAFDELYSVIQENDLVAKYAAQNLNLYEGITLASVIQKEAYAADQPGVAQVFLLRLAKGMTLGSDAIIGYRADQINPNRDKTDMSYLNLSVIGCPWNSRHCTGLPPTPISNPGKSALLSVANPAEGDYIYFLTGDDGKMYYARTDAEHNQNAANYCKKMCSIL